MKFKIEPTVDERLLNGCALMMSQTEPWITLKRDLKGCEEAMRGDHKEVYVTLEEGALLGFIVLQMAGTFKGYIQSICVSPGMRSSGLGTSLILFAEKRIFSVSPNVFMLVSGFNENAKRLYFRLGYEKIGVLKNFVAEGIDEILLRKTIGPLNGFSTRNL
ncbi:MAG TPA: GNAT family N-acetyltransferase [Cyclobacteriaceae bacterium]|nr:GNAT family N-acetyltransferase [Cyclobacteriaceae bacterium]